MCEDFCTFYITVYKAIYHNICLRCCIVNRITDYCHPDEDNRAVITPQHFTLSMAHAHTSITLLCQSSNSTSQLSDKAWDCRADLSLLCLCAGDHELSDLGINMPVALQINAFRVHAQWNTKTLWWTFLTRGKLITVVEPGPLHLCVSPFFFQLQLQKVKMASTTR